LDNNLIKYLDTSLPPPEDWPPKPAGPTKLIILGQDPTVKKSSAREDIDTVLNLNKDRGQLFKYLNRVCNALDLDIYKNIFATNYFNMFFTAPPTQIKEIDILKDYKDEFLPTLKKKLDNYPNIPIISLGEPILKAIVAKGSQKMKSYWGYVASNVPGIKDKFSYIKAEDSFLNREVFPFPHQPAINRIPFYKSTLAEYIKFLRPFI